MTTTNNIRAGDALLCDDCGAELIGRDGPMRWTLDIPASAIRVRGVLKCKAHAAPWNSRIEGWWIDDGGSSPNGFLDLVAGHGAEVLKLY